jgi:hypothetical protein
MIDLKKLSGQDILALTIYGEARGEIIQGQIAVGCVIRNRVERLGSSGYANKYATICLKPLQFSCWNDNDPNFRLLTGMAESIYNDQEIKDKSFIQISWIAKGIYNDLINDITLGATNYLTNSLYETHQVSWANQMKVVARIGNHTFLK